MLLQQVSLGVARSSLAGCSLNSAAIKSRNTLDQPRGVSAPIPPGCSPVEHCKQALEMPPPFGDAASNAELLPSDLRQAVEKLSQLDDPVAFWNSQLVKLEQCIANFQVEEASLQSKVHPQVASVAEKFPSLAFQSLLDEYGHDDSSVANLLKGSNLIGRMGAG